MVAAGTNFEVDVFLQMAQFRPLEVWRRGERRGHVSATLNASSGFSVRISEAEFTEIEKQILDATAFLTRYAADLERLSLFPGVQDLYFDFGIKDRHTGAQADNFPPALLRLL